MEKEEIIQKLNDAKACNRLVEIQREKLETYHWDGFVIELSQHFCLIQCFRDFFCDGYRIYRIKDITRVRSDEKDAFFTRRAVALGYATAGGTAPTFHIPLKSWKSVLVKLQSEKLHVALHEEVDYPDAMQVGELLEVTDHKAVLKTYNTMGEWDEDDFVQDLNKLTMVQFGDRYLHAFQTFVEEPNA